MLNYIQTWGTWIVPPLCLPIQTWSTLCRSHQRSENQGNIMLTKICDLYLKSVVVWVGDDDPVCVADGDVVRVLKLTGLAAHRAELGHKSAVALENLGWKEMLTLVWRTMDKEWLKIEMRQWGTKRPGSCGFLCRRRRWIPMNRCRCPRDSWTSHCHFPGSDCLRCGNWKQLAALNKDQKPQLLPDFQKSSGSGHLGQRSESDGCT